MSFQEQKENLLTSTKPKNGPTISLAVVGPTGRCQGRRSCCLLGGSIRLQWSCSSPHQHQPLPHHWCDHLGRTRTHLEASHSNAAGDRLLGALRASRCTPSRPHHRWRCLRSAVRLLVLPHPNRCHRQHHDHHHPQQDGAAGLATIGFSGSDLQCVVHDI
jgi:hypothetical protein